MEPSGTAEKMREPFSNLFPFPAQTFLLFFSPRKGGRQLLLLLLPATCPPFNND
jgi:hypothetical protein